MATIKQKRAVKKIIEKRGNISRAMREVGYSENTAKNPQNLTASKGFKEVLESYGLTDELIIKALVEDIKYKRYDRKGELELGAKMRGLLTEKVDVTTGGKSINFGFREMLNAKPTRGVKTNAKRVP